MYLVSKSTINIETKTKINSKPLLVVCRTAVEILRALNPPLCPPATTAPETVSAKLAPCPPGSCRRLSNLPHLPGSTTIAKRFVLSERFPVWHDETFSREAVPFFVDSIRHHVLLPRMDHGGPRAPSRHIAAAHADGGAPTHSPTSIYYFSPPLLSPS